MLRLLNNYNWYFKKGDEIPKELFKEEYQTINLPHTYNAQDGQDGGDDYYRGYALYVKELSFTLDNEYTQTYLEA